MKISISPSQNGNGYYTTIKNNYNGVESKMYMTVQLPRDLDLKYGIYNVNCFLSCYTGKDGVVKPKIVVTSLKEQSSQPGQMQNINNQPTSDPFAEFGEEVVNLDDNWLD